MELLHHAYGAERYGADPIIVYLRLYNIMHYTTIDFRLPSGPNYSSLLSDNKDETIIKKILNYCKQTFASIGKEMLIYLIVILILQLINSLVRINTETFEPVTELKDAAHFLFPVLNSSLPARQPSASQIHVKGRDDIQSFAFDLGGSTCACQLQWDIQQYWQRVFYGTKYIVFHCTTSFFGVLCLHRPQWVLIWKVVNEVLEELGNGIVGQWAWTVSVQNVESRYDTLINDLLLAYLPFSALALHIVIVLNLQDPIPLPASITKQYLHQFVLIFAQYIMFNQANQTHNILGDTTWSLFGYELDLGHVLSCTVQIALIFLLVYLKKLQSQQALAISVCTVLIWVPCAFQRFDNNLPANEQINAILSFSLTGLFICAYKFYDCKKHKTQALPFWSLTFPCLIYTSTLCIYFAFESIPTAPKDLFFYSSRWCGFATAKPRPLPPYSCSYK